MAASSESPSSAHSDTKPIEPSPESINPTGDVVNSKDAEESYPPIREAVLIMFAMAAAIFLVSLDRMIIATAIPKISDEFHSIEDIGWYASAYMLTGSSFMLLFGKFYTFYAPKWVLMFAIGLFEIGSAVCGAAPNSTAFIIGRALAGWGFSGIFTGGIITIQSILPLQKRPIAMGMLGAIFGISSIAGPLIGGALTTNVSWRWCFYINLPIGGVALVIFALFLKVKAPAKAGTTWRAQLSQLDPLGTLFFLPGIVCLLLALQWGGSTYAWSNARIIVLFILFAILFTLFVIVQILKKSPEEATVPVHVFTQRSITSGFIYMLFVGAAMALMVYYLSIYFQAIRGVNALHSGLDILPFLLSVTFASIVAGITVSRIGYYVPHMILGAAFMAIGAGLIMTFSVNTSKGVWIGYQILFGVGFGLGNQQASIAAQTVLKKQDIAIGSSLMMFAAQISGAIFVPVGQSVFDNHLLDGLKGIDGVNGTLLLNTGATDIRSVVPAGSLGAVLSAYDNALTRVFLVSCVMAAISVLPALGMEWKSVKKDGKKSGKDADVEGAPEAEKA
ncbi:putative MFS aflatoxin efflux pump [Hyaloscypha variabilis F]|uniref:Putative MFS aflatoxin efflux pump n=1 Tax=Hyaloscypha variabilis (strain UAMH 11265 / GT02V1 / F) TaxID=1149755 RepID=A0A2J6RR71_HYAVF|nr:putative MFS aflatoxin efflux pump [Hyaloscypha variabilis F]